jgi:transmembrane sensor
MMTDLSGIILNANSRLTFAKSWAAGQDREVTLAGEAVFAVRPGEKPQKFKVHLLDGAQVEVLGTTFTVTNRPSLTRVVLNQGKVRVDLVGPQQGKGAQASARMAPGDLVEIDRRENRLTKSRVARPENYSAFVQHKIEFNNTPLSEVARVLQDNYGYKMTFVPASLADKRFTSSNPDNRVDLLLFALEKSFNLQVSRKGKHITLKEL